MEVLICLQDQELTVVKKAARLKRVKRSEHVYAYKEGEAGSSSKKDNL